MQTALVQGLLTGAVAAAVFSAAWLLLRRIRETDALARERARLESERERALQELLVRHAELERQSRESFRRHRLFLLRLLKRRREHLHERERQQAEEARETHRKLRNVEARETALLGREKEMRGREEALRLLTEETRRAHESASRALSAASGMSAEEAKAEFLRMQESAARQEWERRLAAIREKYQQQALEEAKEILARAIRHAAPPAIPERAITVLELPQEDLKARIIGKDGQNVHYFERLTGVDVLVEDIPRTVVLSCYHPVRRARAALAMEILIQEGRFSPTGITEAVERARRLLDEKIMEWGATLAGEAGVDGLADALLDRLGRLRFSYERGYNLYDHVREVVAYAGRLAEETGSDAGLLRRAALLHDIAKVDEPLPADRNSREHVLELLHAYGESERVCDLVTHLLEGGAEPSSEETALLEAAHALSEQRPGMADAVLDDHLKRMRELEREVYGVCGEAEVHAVHAGQEVRVIVHAEAVPDHGLASLAERVAAHLRGHYAHLGEIKVHVFRRVTAMAAPVEHS